MQLKLRVGFNPNAYLSFIWVLEWCGNDLRCRRLGKK
jgi:hypothetical protein